MAITGRFTLLLGLGALPLVAIGAAWVLPAWLLLCLGLGGLDLALAASPRRLGIERETPRRVLLGEPCTAELLIVNHGSRMLRGELRDAWQPSAQAAPRRQPVSIPPGERRRLAVGLRPVRRGLRRSETVTVRAVGPLGLWARQATIAAPASVLVLPPFLSRRHLPSRLARLRELDGQASVMLRGQGTEFDSLREYVRGDDVRSIDWRATARRQDLVVRTWRPERDRRVVIVVDAGRTMAARIGDETRLDTAFETALLLAALASRAGDRVSLLALDRRAKVRVSGTTGAELLPRLMTALAPLEAELIDTDWSALPGELETLSHQRAWVVLLTSLDSYGAARGLLGIAPQLSARHLVTVAVAEDPLLPAAVEDRRDSDAVYLAAAAERALLDADRLSATLHRLGADVVTAAPGALPPALADRYLALKAAGRL